MKKQNYGSILKENIIKTYPDYITQFPNYKKALDIMETIMNEIKPEKTIIVDKFDSEIKKAIQTPGKVIEIIPKTEPTILAWNSDYYFDNYYLWSEFKPKDRNLVTTLELLANASASVKLFLGSRLHLILYDLTGYYNMSMTETLKFKQSFPITQLMNRIRDYFQIPIIQMKESEPLISELQEMKKKVKDNINSEHVQKYMNNLQLFQAKSGIELTTDEKIEFIAEKLLDELVSEDYDEIES